jgi:hypothetical protein
LPDAAAKRRRSGGEAAATTSLPRLRRRMIHLEDAQLRMRVAMDERHP